MFAWRRGFVTLKSHQRQRLGQKSDTTGLSRVEYPTLCYSELLIPLGDHRLTPMSGGCQVRILDGWEKKQASSQ